MSNLLLDSITAATATVPSAGVGRLRVSQFGSDIACGDDANPTFDEVEGDDPIAVGLAVWRLITSDRDSIPDAPGVGFSIRQLLRRPATATEVRTWPDRVRGAILDGEARVESVDVKFTLSSIRNRYDVSINGQTAQGPFSLTGELTADSAILKEILSS